MITMAFGQNEQKAFSFQGYARDFDVVGYSSASIAAQISIYPEGEAVEYMEHTQIALLLTCLIHMKWMPLGIRWLFV